MDPQRKKEGKRVGSNENKKISHLLDPIFRKLEEFGEKGGKLKNNESALPIEEVHQREICRP